MKKKLMSQKQKFNKLIEATIGLGLVLFPINNYMLGMQWGVKVGEIGCYLVLIGSAVALVKTNKVKGVKWINWIVGGIATWIVVDTFVRKESSFNYVLASGFLLLYLVVVSGEYEVRKVFKFAVVVEAISCVVEGVLLQKGLGQFRYYVGGIVTSSGYTSYNAGSANYNLAVGYMCFGWLFVEKKWKMWLLPIVVLGCFFTGSMEGIYIVGGLLIYTIVKKEYNNWFWLELSAVGIFILRWCMYGTGLEIWYRLVPSGEFVKNVAGSDEVSWKLQGLKDFVSGFNWLGNGYKQVVSSKIYDTVHNVPLVIAQQIGIVPAIAWTGVTVWSIVKSKWSVVWIGILLMCALDHYVWTSLCYYWWLAIGLTVLDYENEKNRRKNQVLRSEVV